MTEEEAYGLGVVKASEFIKYFEEKYPLDESLSVEEKIAQFTQSMREGQALRSEYINEFRKDLGTKGFIATAIDDEVYVSVFTDAFTEHIGEWLKEAIDVSSGKGIN